MISLKISHGPLSSQKSDCLAVVVKQNGEFTEPLRSVSEKFFSPLEATFKKQNFTGAAGSVLAVSGNDGTHPVELLFAGIGQPTGKHTDVEVYRRALGRIIRSAEVKRIEHISLLLPASGDFGLNDHDLAQQTAITLLMGAYHFDHYITDPERTFKKLKECAVILEGHDVDAVKKGIEMGMVIAHSVNKARLWIDMPPSDLTPTDLAGKAQEIAKKHSLGITVFAEAELIKMGLGGLTGVSRGSDADCHLVILEYKTSVPNAPTIAFVGKGITFDSGGLSLKPAASMETMKEDMSGAAAVISTLEALAQLKPNVNVLGITPLSENLPSGKATKPGDILKFYNGKTAEVKNTDAEGRLILADALSYAVKHYKPDAIIDIATLTGACAAALGPFFTGLLSQHDELVERVVRSSERSGDRVWRLPMDNDFKPAIKSAVADLSNIGSQTYKAGAITAAFFLQPFVGETPWVHLDIAGTAFNVPDISYYRTENATGAGVRLLVDLAMNWK